MNKQTIQLLRKSFAEIAARKPTVAALFYERLFKVAPGVRPLFTSAPEEQQRKLTTALAHIVAALDQPEKFAAHLEKLGKSHAAYGAEPAHYAVVGDTLLWTFAQVLGKDFTPEVREAWTSAYGAIAAAMQDAASRATVSSRGAAAARRTHRPAAESGRRKAAKRSRSSSAKTSRARKPAR